MKLPYLENTAKTIQYIAYWILFAVLQTIVFSFIIDLPVWILISENLFNGLIFGALGILLWSVIHYGKYSTLPHFQLIINYAALGILSISIWTGAAYSFMVLIYGNESASQFNRVIPLKIFIGLLVYIIIIQRFTTIQSVNSDSEAITDSHETDHVETDETTETAPKSNREILERIAVKSGSKIHVILIPEIIYLQSDGDYVQIFTANGKYLKEQTMKYFEDHLPESLFVRVHRTHIVNVEMISRIELYEKQSQLLTLKNGHQIKTSPAGYKALRTTLNL